MILRLVFLGQMVLSRFVYQFVVKGVEVFVTIRAIKLNLHVQLGRIPGTLGSHVLYHVFFSDSSEWPIDVVWQIGLPFAVSHFHS